MMKNWKRMCSGQLFVLSSSGLTLTLFIVWRFKGCAFFNIIKAINIANRRIFDSLVQTQNKRSNFFY